MQNGETFADILLFVTDECAQKFVKMFSDNFSPEIVCLCECVVVQEAMLCYAHKTINILHCSQVAICGM